MDIFGVRVGNAKDRSAVLWLAKPA